MVRRAGLGWGVLVAGTLLVAACSSSGSKSVSAPAGASPATTASASTATVLVGSSKVGPVLTDASGKTLYTDDKDTAGTTTSACTGGCASAWPPLTATSSPTAGPGVTGTLATISGGQVTWNGHPLYRWMGDNAAGDVTGDGVNGFHVAMASASGAGSSPAPTTPPTSSRRGGSGY